MEFNVSALLGEPACTDEARFLLSPVLARSFLCASSFLFACNDHFPHPPLAWAGPLECYPLTWLPLAPLPVSFARFGAFSRCEPSPVRA